MHYFSNCQTLDEAKTLFKKLCFELHPDTSKRDSQAEFIAMFKEFQSAAKRLKFQTGKEADKDFNESKFYDIVKNFDCLPSDIIISFVGSWIWIEGNTKPCKDLIKAIKIEGYNTARWHKVKKVWFLAPSDSKRSKFSGKKTLEQIKNTYGCNTYQSKGRKTLAA